MCLNANDILGTTKSFRTDSKNSVSGIKNCNIHRWLWHQRDTSHCKASPSYVRKCFWLHSGAYIRISSNRLYNLQVIGFLIPWSIKTFIKYELSIQITNKTAGGCASIYSNNISTTNLGLSFNTTWQKPLSIHL